ncbi:cell division protein FtsQ [Salipaludibacillus agaradhaerens]|uniref:Cell division protein FtsQ n=1 Tax=Salipaludibacillus agaradhaerens TaxID=76935 RepID=A0A9Q4FYY4_SALAG|nr:cell division protein FtsQ [Salipaludibacillus agaradhaerens]MCR6096228.1 cell division protein FtsQ [Salipaludibacillus agaradhaerens]MCR6114213.1 cell division protein FtsQ [Salipaludibacillus agaradhaerens]
MTQLKKRYSLTQSQKMMVFILSMSLYGLSNMITELLPKVYLGPVEFSVEYFAFIPLTLCILFHPLYAAVGASLGEVIFGEIMLGQFGGLGELEKFIAFSLAMYVAGTMVKNPKNRLQVGVAAISGVAIHQFISAVVDIGKVWIGVEELEAVPGLAESIVVIEGFSFLNDVLFSGILFALLPTLYLVPRLYGKIEPLLGMKPRDNTLNYSLKEVLGPRVIVILIILSGMAMIAEFLAEAEITLVEWDIDFVALFGERFIFIVIGVATLISVMTIWLMRKQKNAKNGEDRYVS